MTLIRRTGSFIALALSLACASDSMFMPKEGLRFAFSQPACGPADGPAVAIFLTRDPSNGPSPVPPYARIYIDGPVTALDGSKHSFGTGSSDAAAALTLSSQRPVIF